MKSLPKGDLSPADRQKLSRLTEIFVSHAQQFELTSVDPKSLKISEENYRPEHAGFDLEFDLSASDMIRTIWAYLHSLLEFAADGKSNHLQLLVLDEPRQQETARTSFRQLFTRAGAFRGAKQQVIIATSEEEATLRPLLGDVPHQFISFKERIVKPLYKRTDTDAAHKSDEGAEEDADDIEMPWEAETHAAVKRAIDSFEWDKTDNVIRYVGVAGEKHEAASYDELYNGLCAVARDAWSSLVPFEDGEAVFPPHEDSIVERLLEPRAADIQTFFDQH